MGRPVSETSLFLVNLFRLNVQRFIKETKVLPPKDGVWMWFRKKLKNSDFNMNEKAIYSAASRWWRQQNERDKTPPVEPVNDFEMTATSENSLNSSNEVNPQVIKCSIKLEYKKWKTIEPVEVKYQRNDTLKGVRTYVVMQPGVWSNVVVDEISKKNDMPCGWSFKTNKCYSNKATFRAVCTTCSAILCGTIDRFPDENEPVKINIEVRGVNARRHEITKKKNVKIVGQKADDIAASGKSTKIGLCHYSIAL